MQTMKFRTPAIRTRWQDDRIDDLSGKVDNLDRTVHEGFSAVRTEMREEFQAVRTEMREEFSAVRTEMRDEFRAVRGEMREEFRAVHARFDEAHRTMIGMHRTMILMLGAIMSTMVAGFAAVLATQA